LFLPWLAFWLFQKGEPDVEREDGIFLKNALQVRAKKG
jgi:hypothetical protein